MSRKHKRDWDQEQGHKAKSATSPLVAQSIEHLPTKEWESGTGYVANETDPGESRSTEHLSFL